MPEGNDYRHYFGFSDEAANSPLKAYETAVHIYFSLREDMHPLSFIQFLNAVVHGTLIDTSTSYNRNTFSSCKELRMDTVCKTDIVSSERPSDNVNIEHMSNRKNA